MIINAIQSGRFPLYKATYKEVIFFAAFLNDTFFGQPRQENFILLLMKKKMSRSFLIIPLKTTKM